MNHDMLPKKQRKLSPLLLFLLIVLAATLCWGATFAYGCFLVANDPNPAMRLKPLVFIPFAFHWGWKLLLKMALGYLGGFALLGLLIFAFWNRCADRLNRESSPAQPAIAATSGVWPPPPIISSSADTVPRI